MNNQNNDLIDRYVHWLETLRREGAHRISQFVSADLRMRTPEHDAQGRDGAAQLFAAMFDAGTVTTKILNRAWGSDGHTVFLRWDRLVTDPGGGRHVTSGITELMIGMDGKIVAINDYTDTPPDAPRGFFARLFNR